MKRYLSLLIPALFLASSCSMQKAKRKNRLKVSQYRKKPRFGEHVKWIILGIFENERDEQLRKTHEGNSDPVVPPGY